jgi:hypothetical protein
MATKKPNILIILWGNDIGTWNISYFSRGMMGYHTPNINRVAHEGCSFTEYSGEEVEAKSSVAISIIGKSCARKKQIPAG